MNRNARGRARQLDCNLLFDGVALKAYTKTVDGKEVKFLGGTASSTAKDLYGDVIGPEGQVKMLEKLKSLASDLASQKSGLTGWLNHSYKIPEDTLGAFVNASLTTRDDAGETFIDLDIELRLTETNPRALAAWEQVKDGIRHGWSIGAYFLEAEWMSDDPDSPDYWSLHVTDIELLEISLVGIPANQRAWCRSAADLKSKALKEAEKIARGARDAADDERRSLVLKSLLASKAEIETAESVVKSAVPEVQPDVKTVPAAADVAVRSAIVAELREHASSAGDDASELRATLLGAAAALEQKDSPDDARDLIGMAISHVTKAVGHGLCIKSASHVAKALDCLTGAIGVDGGEAMPDGDEDPDEKAAALVAALGIEFTKLAPKAGDVVFIRVADEERVNELAAALGSVARPEGVSFLCLSGDAVASIDSELVAKRNALEEATRTCADAEARRNEAMARCTEIEAKFAAARSELDALNAKIEAAKNTRLGHKSVQVGDSQRSAGTEVRPEDYEQNNSQLREALARTMSGGASTSARDVVAAQ